MQTFFNTGILLKAQSTKNCFIMYIAYKTEVFFKT